MASREDDSPEGVVRRALTPAAVQKLRNVFSEMDTDASGSVSVAEFQEACARLSLAVNSDELDAFLQADSGDDAALDFDEFCAFYVGRLRSVFEKIDRDRGGEISADELGDAFRRLGYDATPREVRAMLAEVDSDGSETVDFREFCSYFCSLPSPSLRSVVEKWASGLSMDVGTDLAPPPLPPASVPVWRALLAGGLAGVVSRTATAPLEKIKILAQTSSTGTVQIVSTFKRVLQSETWRGLFAGNGANCIRVLPFASLVCLAYSNLAKHFPLDKGNSRRQAMWRMGAGALAGTFAAILTHPMDVVRAKLTVQTPANSVYKGLFPSLMLVFKNEGMAGLYRGIGPTLLAIAPFMAVQQSSYDVLKHLAIKRDMEATPTLFFACGSSAGAIAQTVIYPLDVIRRRMQVGQGLTGSTSWSQTMAATTSGSGLIHHLRSLPLRQLYAGLTATYMKVIPAAAISLVCRDAILGRLS